MIKNKTLERYEDLKNHRKPIDHRKKNAAYGGFGNDNKFAPSQTNENPASFFGNFPQSQPQKIAQPIQKPSYQNPEPVRVVPKIPEPNLIDLLDQPEENTQSKPPYVLY